MEERIFQAQSMLEALEKVQDEMGPDAVVVSVRELQSPAWSLQKKTIFEIKAAPAGFQVKPQPKEIQPKAAPKLPAAAQPAPAAKGPLAQAPEGPLLRDDASTIEWLVDDKQAKTTQRKPQARAPLPAAPAQPATPPPARSQAPQVVLPAIPAKVEDKTPAAAPVPALSPADLPAILAGLKKRLLAQDLDPAILDRVFDLAGETLSPQSLKNEAMVQKYISRQLEVALRVSPPRDLKPPAPVVCLIGLSGSGKTSLAARMAMHYGSHLGKKVAWICADVIRAGAIAEARTYTDALNLPLQVVYTPVELKSALSEAAGAELILIDLPGYNPLDEDQVAELGAILTEIPQRCLLLVASASQKEKDLLQAAASFGVFGLNGLVITKMDETLTLGSIYNLALKSQIPLVYFSSGKGSAGRLQSASAERLVSALFNHGDF